MIHVSDGATCLFWEDLWNSRVPRLSYPELFSFAKDPLVSLNSEALHQLTELAQGLSDLPISSEHDSWTYIWGTPFFSSARAYVHLTWHRLVHPIFSQALDLCMSTQTQVLFWLLLYDRLSTRNILRKKKYAIALI